MVSLWFRKVSCSGFRIRTQQAPGASLGRFLSGFLSPRHRGSRALTLSLQTSARFAHHVEGDEFRCKKNKDVCRAQAVESHADVLGNSDGWEMFQRIRNSEGGVGWFCRSLKSVFVSLAPLGAPGTCGQVSWFAAQPSVDGDFMVGTRDALLGAMLTHRCPGACQGRGQPPWVSAPPFLAGRADRDCSCPLF